MVEAYQNSLEHIIDELKLLDIELGYAISKFIDNNGRQEWNEYSGLYISEKEIKNEFKKDTTEGETPDNSSAFSKDAAAYKIAHMNQIIQERKEQSKKEGVTLHLERLSELLSLSSFEISIIIVCLAPEMDSKYEKVYAYLHNDVTKKKPTMGLILNLLCSSMQEKIESRRFFLQSSPLFRFKILEFDLRGNEGSTGGLSLNHYNLSCPLKIDGHVVNLLLDHDEINPRIEKFSNLIKFRNSFSMDSAFQGNLIKQKNRIIELVEDWQQQQYITRQLQQQQKNDNKANSKNLELFHENGLNFYFNAPYGAGKKTLAKLICSKLGLSLLIIDISDALHSEEFEEIIDISFREALLHDAIIYLDHIDVLFEKEEKISSHNLRIIVRNIKNFSKTVVAIFSAEKPPQTEWYKAQIQPLMINFPSFTYEIRKKIWDSVMSYYNMPTNEIDINDLATKFQFTPGQIKDIILTTKKIASLKNINKSEAPISSDDIYTVCRLQSNEKLSSLSMKGTAKYTWDDLVLSQEKKQQLKEIFNHVKYRNLVYSDWGFESKLALGKGINILFAGESGTGKTMAAQIIANELKLDLYRIDLSSIVSKFIGETEKNISRIFKEAETSNAILCFDEADALFGKRTEIKEAHDRYANIEMSYLLQKLEEHSEIVILASNLAKNVDDAIIRRMHFWVEFPFPDTNSRLKIWKSIFPETAPLSNDIYFDFLAKQFQISGGIIKNAALSAAFYAAEESKSISMNHIVKAIKREFDKVGKPCLKSDFGKYFDLLNDTMTG